MKRNINTIALFSGGGGLDLGFSAAGFKIKYSSDIDHHSCETLKKNQGKRPYLGRHIVEAKDIAKLSGTYIKSQINCEVDFVIGGPPCQAFSVSGKRKGLEDPRGNLVYEYARLIKELNPIGFVFENVAGLKTIHGGDLYKELLDILSISGLYKIVAHEYDLASYGIPQFRKRVFLIGSRHGVAVPELAASHGLIGVTEKRPYAVVKSMLDDLPVPIVEWSGQPSVNGHVGRKHSIRIKERYAQLSHGERDHKTRINKLHPERPSYTIIVGSDKGGGKGHVHPYQSRELTPRESARIQTFPDWWEFSGTGRHIIRQVGNAVPPLFAAQIATHISSQLFSNSKTLTYDQLLSKLDLNFLKDAVY